MQSGVMQAQHHTLYLPFSLNIEGTSCLPFIAQNERSPSSGKGHQECRKSNSINVSLLCYTYATHFSYLADG